MESQTLPTPPPTAPEPTADEGVAPPTLVKQDEELTKLQQMTADSQVHEETMADAEDDESIRRSVYVGNVDYGATPQELQQHFATCGDISRITIMVDKMTGHPKGFAYIEFAEVAGANSALMLANTTFRERSLKVSPKRKNIAGFNGANRGGRGFRGRGVMPYGPVYGMPYGPAASLRIRGRAGRGGIRGKPY